MQLIRLNTNLNNEMFCLKRNWNEEKNWQCAFLEVVNPRICLLGEGRSFRSAPLVLWVSQVKNPVIISIVGISLQSATSSKGIYNRCGPRKNNLTHTDFDPIVEFKIFSRGSWGFRTIFNTEGPCLMRLLVLGKISH